MATARTIATIILVSAALGAAAAFASAVSQGNDGWRLTAAQAGETADASAKTSAAAGPYPGGARSVQESFGDWTMSCIEQKGAKICALSQQHVDAKTRQHVMTVEVMPQAEGAAKLTLLMPFGLTLDKGVLLQADEGETIPARFKTCLPAGCLVALDMASETMAELVKASSLKVTVTAVDGADAAFEVSLNGLAGAIDRAAVLVN